MNQLVTWMIFLPAAGALACLTVTADRARHVALGTAILTFLISCVLAIAYDTAAAGPQLVTAVDWIDAINAQYRVGLDGLSLPLVLLTTALSVLVILASWSITKHCQAYFCLYLLLLTGMLGVFTALDLFLFYVFFEVSLLPMYFLIGVWGGPRKEYAAIKFFLYTLAGSICLLIVMMGLYFITGQGGSENTWILTGAAAGETSLDSESIRNLFAEGGDYWTFAQWAFWLTLVAFLIKLPSVPFHTWLPDAHVEAPTPISMVLAGVLLKLGGYAMMRITWPLFPEAASTFWVCVAGIGTISIIYGALCAMAQTDWKKLVAYSSVSHMGYVTLGLAVLNRTGFDGAYFQMIAHGITSAMMFFLVGVVYERAHHRDIERFGGLWLKWPSYGMWSVLGFFAAMGLPGLCGFIGEVLVLLGTFQAAGEGQVGADQVWWVYLFGSLAASGVVLTAGYMLWMFRRVYMGKPRPAYDHYPPVSAREQFIMATLGIAAVIFGVLPILIFALTDATMTDLMLTFVTKAG